MHGYTVEQKDKRRKPHTVYFKMVTNKPPRPSIARSIPLYFVIPSVGAVGTFMYAYYSMIDEAPFTKRKRLLATSSNWERQMGDKEYKSLLKKYRKDILPHNHPATITVKRVGSRIADSSRRFAEEHKLISQPQEKGKVSNYTYTVVRSTQANAFVLPNNHVFVLTGLFKFAKDEDELAAVLGHEMAHNLARHAGEKVSSSILTSIIARAMLLIDPSGVLYSLFMPASVLLHSLPHSRDAETEADYIGLHLAADACYDPKAAQRVFRAMKNETNPVNKKTKQRSPSSSPPEFMSTHPSYDTRLQNLASWMPDAEAKLNIDDGLKCKHVREEMKVARKLALQARIRNSYSTGLK